MVGIADQIQFCAEHARTIIDDLTAKRGAPEALALLRVYHYAFEREVKTLEIQERMREFYRQVDAPENVSRETKKFVPFVIQGGAA